MAPRLNDQRTIAIILPNTIHGCKKKDLQAPRLGALPYLACTSRPCWGKASFGARLAARFLLILQRVRLVCGWRSGAGDRQPLASKINFVYKIKFVRFPQSTSETLGAGCRASPEQCLQSSAKRQIEENITLEQILISKLLLLQYIIVVEGCFSYKYIHVRFYSIFN